MSDMVDYQDSVRGRIVTALLGDAKFYAPANEEIDLNTAADLLSYYWSMVVEEWRLAGSPDNFFPIQIDGLLISRFAFVSREGVPICEDIERGLVPSPGVLKLLAMRCWALGIVERFQLLDSMCADLELAIERARSIRQ